MSDPGTQMPLGEAVDVDTLVIGASPTQSFAMLDAAMTEALGLAMYNAVAAQQNASTARNAAVLMTCAAMLSLPIADVAASSAPAARADAPAAAVKTPPESTAATPRQTATAAATGAAPAKSDASAMPDGDPVTVDPHIIDAINQMQRAVISPEIILASGAGKAYQLVAQSAAIAVQDAADTLRGVSIIATTAAGVAVTRFLSTGDAKFLLGVTAARDMMVNATEDFAKTSLAAAGAVKEFPALPDR